MIFDDVADAMNSESVYKLSLKTGLSRDKIRRLSQGVPFVLDYNTIFALQKMGYDVVLVPKK